MNKTYSTMLASVFGLMMSANVIASDTQEAKIMDEDSRLTIEFIEPEKFTDIRPSNESRKKFREHVLSSMEKYFDELTDTLPNGQTLDVTVTDIDLAGDTRSPRVPIGSQMFDVRVIEDIYFPRIKFSYTLKNDAGEVLKSEDVDLKDMNFLNRTGRFTNRDAFKYERVMIEGWFKDTFETTKKSK
jgi:hypothetical protein